MLFESFNSAVLSSGRFEGKCLVLYFFAISCLQLYYGKEIIKMLAIIQAGNSVVGCFHFVLVDFTPKLNSTAVINNAFLSCVFIYSCRSMSSTLGKV